MSRLLKMSLVVAAFVVTTTPAWAGMTQCCSWKCCLEGVDCCGCLTTCGSECCCCNCTYNTCTGCFTGKCCGTVCNKKCCGPLTYKCCNFFCDPCYCCHICSSCYTCGAKGACTYTCTGTAKCCSGGGTY